MPADNMNEKIRSIVAACRTEGLQASEAGQNAAAAIDRVLEARSVNEWASGDRELVCMTPLLLADLLEAAAGVPVRLGAVCFNGAPPCDHASYSFLPRGRDGVPYARCCPDCNAPMRAGGLDSSTFDSLVAAVVEPTWEEVPR